jgi:GntR family transcriptional regulator
MPARRQTFREIADDMQERIQLGEYPPGSEIPSYRELAEIYSVSVATAQRAVWLLQDRGLVVGRQGVALYVAKSPGSARQ